MTATRPSRPAGHFAGLLKYVRKRRIALLAALVLAALVGLLEASAALVFGMVISTIAGSNAAAALQAVPSIARHLGDLDRNYLLLMLIGVVAVKALAEYGAVSTTAYVGQAAIRDLRSDLFGRIVSQPLRFFQENPTGELISRVSADVEQIQTAVSEALADFIQQCAIVLFLLPTVIVIDWRLSALTVLLVPVLYGATAWFGRALRALSHSNQQELASMSNILYEAFSGNRIVKAYGMEPVEKRRFGAAADGLFRINLRRKMTYAVWSPMMEALGVLIIAGFVLYAWGQIDAQRANVGMFGTFIYALVNLYNGIRRISVNSHVFQQALGASGRVFEIMAFDTERDTGATELQRFERSLEFRDVVFGYTPDTPVLRGVSFEGRAGEVIALVGPSGGGKTTLVNLPLRFYDVNTGAVLIDGHDVRDCTLSSLRRQIAMVTQDVILFDDTIWNNIAYGDPAASHDAVLRAAKAALVDNFAAALPEGYDTRIGERGLKLSGGQRQRISIARALLRNAPILILDEATSALDSESEAEVQLALERLMEGRTTIVIAHRLSTIRNASRILVLDAGRITESGSHDDLIAQRGHYWRLYNLQFSEERLA